MDPALAVGRARRIQAAFQVLVILQLSAIHWPQQAVVLDDDHYSFIIVGGGTAGCVLANRLTESRFKVLLIEAGGDPPFEAMLPGLAGYLPKTPVDWNYTEQYDRHRAYYQNGIEMPLTQGKVLGGSSSINFMSYMRGHPHDYNSWADKLGDQSWNYENVLPYFKKSEHMDDPVILASNYRRFHGTDGYLHDIRQTDPKTKDYLNMFRELGHKILLDFNGEETLGYGEPTFTIGQGVRQSTAFSFIRPAKYRHNLHVLKNTLVTKILFDDFKNAIGVQALTQDRKLITIMADKEVIITAGAFNSAKILMLSGIGPKEDLRPLSIKVVSDLPVGLQLKEQPASLVAYEFKRLNNTPTPTNYARYHLNALFGYVSLSKSHTYPDTESMCLIHNNSSGILELCAFNLGLSNETCQAIYEAGKGRELLICIRSLLYTKSSGKVKLQSANPEDNPLVSFRTYSEEEDIEAMVNAVEELDKLRTSSLYKNGGGRIIDHRLPRCRELKFGSREYWRCHVLSTRLPLWHYSGACGMGRVVDSRLRVYGVRSLRVADSSAMPSLPRGHSMAPVIMVAEKAADMIKADNRY